MFFFLLEKINFGDRKESFLPKIYWFKIRKSKVSHTRNLFYTFNSFLRKKIIFFIYKLWFSGHSIRVGTYLSLWHLIKLHLDGNKKKRFTLIKITVEKYRFDGIRRASLLQSYVFLGQNSELLCTKIRSVEIDSS